MSALTRISGQQSKNRSRIACNTPTHRQTGYYSSLIVSRNFLRFSFAPLILFLPFPQWNLRYAWSRPQNAVSWFRLLSASLFLHSFSWRSLDSLFPSMYISLILFLSLSLRPSLIHESHSLSYCELSIRDAPRQTRTLNGVWTPYCSTLRLTAPFGEYIMQWGYSRSEGYFL